MSRCGLCGGPLDRWPATMCSRCAKPRPADDSPAEDANADLRADALDAAHEPDTEQWAEVHGLVADRAEVDGA